MMLAVRGGPSVADAASVSRRRAAFGAGRASAAGRGRRTARSP